MFKETDGEAQCSLYPASFAANTLLNEDKM